MQDDKDTTFLLWVWDQLQPFVINWNTPINYLVLREEVMKGPNW